MKTHTLLNRLDDLLRQNGRSKTWDEMQALRKVLRDLRGKQRKLESKLRTDITPSEQDEIHAKLRVIREQRRKGVARLRTVFRDWVDN